MDVLIRVNIVCDIVLSPKLLLTDSIEITYVEIIQLKKYNIPHIQGKHTLDHARIRITLIIFNK